MVFFPLHHPVFWNTWFSWYNEQGDTAPHRPRPPPPSSNSSAHLEVKANDEKWDVHVKTLETALPDSASFLALLLWCESRFAALKALISPYCGPQLSGYGSISWAGKKSSFSTASGIHTKVFIPNSYFLLHKGLVWNSGWLPCHRCFRFRLQHPQGALRSSLCYLPGWAPASLNKRIHPGNSLVVAKIRGTDALTLEFACFPFSVCAPCHEPPQCRPS